ncbi:MAG: DUF4345 domain-containing protein [Pseudomonadota bacterium]
MRIFLLLIATSLFFFSAAYILTPEQMAEATGISHTKSGLTDFRATYGGLQLGLAVFLVWSAFAKVRFKSAFFALGVLMACLAVLRVYGMMVDGSPDQFHYIGLAYEIPIALISTWFYFKSSRLQRITADA